MTQHYGTSAVLGTTLLQKGWNSNAAVWYEKKAIKLQQNWFLILLSCS